MGKCYWREVLIFTELFSGTDRLTNVQGIKKLYTYIETTYLPVMKQGEVFDMTRGRACLDKIPPLVL